MDDDALVTAFDSLALAPSQFGHREHIRVAYALLVREGDLAAAAIAFRAMLRRFADHHGAAGKYHETITWAYLAIIAERMAAGAYSCSEDLLAAHPDLLDHKGGALARHYDVAELLASPHARAAFVLPRRP